MTSRQREVTTPKNNTIRSSSIFSSQTPRGRTSFDRPLRHSGSGDEISANESNTNDALLELINITWDIWAVSPLFGLECNDKIKMKLYAKRLRENLSSSLNAENVSYEAKFTCLDLVYSFSDPPAVKIEVHSMKDQDDGDAKNIYVGIFLSWGPRPREDPRSLKLPILLSRGTESVTRAAHLTLSQLFDCSITAMPASQEDLMWLTAIILDSCDKVQNRKTKTQVHYELSLDYRVPGLPASDLISIQLPINSVISLWSKICPSQPSSNNPTEQIAGAIELKHVEKFHECIRIQMLNNLSLELGYCLLDKVSLPRLIIKANKMKARDIDAMNRVLRFFQEKALLNSPALILANSEGD